MSVGGSESEVLSENSSQPVNLTRVEVVGGDDFTDNFFNKLLSPLLSSSDLTVGQLVSKCDTSLKNLQHSHTFDDIKVTVAPDNQAKDITTVLDTKALNLYTKFQLTPKKLKNFSIGATNNNYGNLLHLTYTNLNTFGNSEYFQLHSVINLIQEQKARLVSLDYKAPMVDTTFKLFVKGLVANSKNTSFQSLQQLKTYGIIGLEKEHIFPKCGSKATGTAGVSFSKRSTLQVADSAHDEIKTYSGDHFNEALHLNLKLQNLEHLPSSKKGFATNGYFLNLKNEYSGLTSSNPKTNDKYYKFEAQSAFIKSLLNYNFTLASSFNVGHLVNLSTTSSTIHFQDKFYLPLAGYQTLGLSNSVSKIGGLSYLSYDFSLYSRFFFTSQHAPLRFFLSLNGGDLFNSLDEIKKLKSLTDLKNGSSIGVTYKVGDSVDCKLYYKVPLTFKDTDFVKPGFGFSVSINGEY